MLNKTLSGPLSFVHAWPHFVLLLPLCAGTHTPADVHHPLLLQVGISLNYDKICMCLDFAPLIGGLEYASRYPAEWNK